MGEQGTAAVFLRCVRGCGTGIRVGEEEEKKKINVWGLGRSAYRK